MELLTPDKTHLSTMLGNSPETQPLASHPEEATTNNLLKRSADSDNVDNNSIKKVKADESSGLNPVSEAVNSAVIDKVVETVHVPDKVTVVDTVMVEASSQPVNSLVQPISPQVSMPIAQSTVTNIDQMPTSVQHKSPSLQPSAIVHSSDLIQNQSTLVQEPALIQHQQPLSPVKQQQDTPLSEESVASYIHPYPIYKSNHTNFPVPSDDELNKTQLKYAGTIIKNLKRSKDAYLFLLPVDPIKLNIPQYPDIIKTPMDLSTVERKLNAMEFANFQEFHVNVELIFDNCFTFNGRDSFVSKMADSVQKTYHKLLEKIPTEIKIVHPKKKSMDHRVSETFTDLTRPKRPVSQSYSQAPLSPVKKKVSKKNPAELKFCASVLRELMNKKHTALNYPFLTPVDAIALGIPQYLQIIQNPMDLSKIKRKLDHGEYNDGEDFEEDVRLMFNNCYTFNRPEDDVYQLGKKLENIFDEKWASKPTMPVLGSHKSRGDDSSDEEYENQQIVLLQQNLALMSSQLAVLMDKRRKRKDKRKNEALGYPVQPQTVQNSQPKKAKAKKEDENIPEITFEMKKEISEKINLLQQEQIIHVFQIIREGMPSLGAKENEEEIELDIDSLDKRTLYRLFKYIKEHAGAKVAEKFGADSESSGSDSGSE